LEDTLDREIEQSLMKCQQSLDLNRSLDNREGEAESLHQMSILYQELFGNLEQALIYSRQSLEITREIENQQKEADLLHQIWMILYDLDKFEEAIVFCQKCLELKIAMGNRAEEAQYLGTIASIYEELGELDRAFTFCEQSLELKRASGDSQGEVYFLDRLAILAGKQDDFDREQELYLQIVNVLSSIDDYDSLITTLYNLGTNEEPTTIIYLAQALWLTIQIPKDLEGAINLIDDLSERIPVGDFLEALLGAAALYLCQTFSHPKIVEFKELSGRIISRSANRQGINNQEDYNNWKIKNRLNDAEYFMHELYNRLESIVGDSWSFDRQAFYNWYISNDG
jgi:tetratricopeptide (TPR) repeat protein